MVWNEKHHEFCLSQNMWDATKNLIFYLYKKCNSNESKVIEFDRDKFQRYMKQNKGKEYHRTYIRKIVKQAESKSEGAIIIQKDYGRGVYKIIVHPISFVTENRKPLQESAHNEIARNCMFSEQHKKEESRKQQQFISRVDELLKKIGLKFDADALQNIYRLSGKSIDRVVKAIELLLHRNSSKKIPKPHGFIIECLKKRWSEGFDLYYEPDLPTFQFKGEIQSFVNNICASLDISSSGKIRRGKSSEQKKYVPDGTQLKAVSQHTFT